MVLVLMKFPCQPGLPGGRENDSGMKSGSHYVSYLQWWPSNIRNYFILMVQDKIFTFSSLLIIFALYCTITGQFLVFI